MATYFDPNRNSKIDYTNVKKVLDDVLPAYAKSGGTFTRAVRKYGKHVFAHNPTFRCVKQPPGVRRMPTTPSITCGRSYGTIITFCYRVDSKIGPRACRQSRTRTSDKNSFASSRSLRKSSIKMSFVPRGSSTSEINRPAVRTPTQCHIDLACNTSYHFAASRTVFPRVSPYLSPGPFAPFGTRI